VDLISQHRHRFSVTTIVRASTYKTSPHTWPRRRIYITPLNRPKET
jgi:hypothetical protein